MCSVFIFILLYCSYCGLFFVFNLLWFIALLESMSGCLQFWKTLECYFMYIAFVSSLCPLLPESSLPIGWTFSLCSMSFVSSFLYFPRVCASMFQSAYVLWSSSLLIPSSAVSYLLLSPYIEFPISFLSSRFHLVLTS